MAKEGNWRNQHTVRSMPENIEETFKMYTKLELMKLYDISSDTAFGWAKKLGMKFACKCNTCGTRDQSLFPLDAAGAKRNGTCSVCAIEKKKLAKLKKKLRQKSKFYEPEIFDVPQIAWDSLKANWGKGGPGCYLVQRDWYNEDRYA